MAMWFIALIMLFNGPVLVNSFVHGGLQLPDWTLNLFKPLVASSGSESESIVHSGVFRVIERPASDAFTQVLDSPELLQESKMIKKRKKKHLAHPPAPPPDTKLKPQMHMDQTAMDQSKLDKESQHVNKQTMTADWRKEYSITEAPPARSSCGPASVWYAWIFIGFTVRFAGCP